MITTAEILSPEDFERWYAESTTTEAGVARGKQLIEEHGCLGCHSFDGSSSIATTFGVLKGSKRMIMRAGTEKSIEVDAEYLRRSIRVPGADLVEGFSPIMPAYGDEINEADLDEIINFLLNGDSTPALEGNKLIEDHGCLGCHSTDGSEQVGPSFKGLGNRTSEVKRGKQELKLKVDADYLRRAIREPNYELVEGYPAIMPSNDQLSDEEVEAMIDELLKK